MTEAIERLQARLDEAASAESRDWWERYLKGTAAFRGVPMSVIRRAVRDWSRDEALDALSPRDQKQLALELLSRRYSEDKLAGVLLLREHLLPAIGTQDLPSFARSFAPVTSRTVISATGSRSRYSPPSSSLMDVRWPRRSPPGRIASRSGSDGRLPWPSHRSPPGRRQLRGLYRAGDRGGRRQRPRRRAVHTDERRLAPPGALKARASDGAGLRF
jgi:hypothetical protein